MLDPAVRRTIAAPLDRAAAAIDRPWLTPDSLTVAGLVVGIGAAVAAGYRYWWIALGLWLASRLVDGIDGPLARRRSRAAQGNQAGGFLDIMCDFVVYGSFVVGVAVGSGDPLTPFLLVLLAYYLNGSAFLAFSSIAERTGKQIDDGRSFSFLGGLAGGTETIVVHSLWCIVPMYASEIAWVWATIVFISAAQRIVGGYRALR